MALKEKEVWSNIIELYKDLPNLWDKSNKNYLNRSMRDEGFKLLLTVYKEYDKDCTVAVLKKKLENMRTCYTRELKKVKSSAQTGSGSSDIYVPSLWYFDLFKFLDEHSEPAREAIDTFDKASDGHDPQLSAQSEDSQNQNGTDFPRKKKMRMSIAKKQEMLLDSAQQLLNTKDDDSEIIGKSIAVQLKELNKEQLFIVNKIISDAIFYAKTGKLTIESSINLGTGNQSNLHTSYYPQSYEHQYTTQSLSSCRPHHQPRSSSALSNYDSTSPHSSTYFSPPYLMESRSQTPTHQYITTSPADYPVSQTPRNCQMQESQIQSPLTQHSTTGFSFLSLLSNDFSNTTFTNQTSTEMEKMISQ